MLYRYNLKVSFDGYQVFDGNFSSINQLVKTACCFSDDCTFESFDQLFGNAVPVCTLMSEFKRHCNGI